MVLEEKEIKDSEIVDQIETPELIVRLRKDGIVHITLRKHLVYDIEVQTKLLDINIKITGGKKSFFIYDAEENVIITKEARDNSHKIEQLAPSKGSAAIASNLAYRIIGNFYLKVNKPKIPFKVFDNFDKGIEWLKTLPE